MLFNVFKFVFWFYFFLHYPLYMWPLTTKPVIRVGFLNSDLYKKTETQSESWIYKLSVDVWFVKIEQYLAEIQLFVYVETEDAKNIYKYSKYWENCH